MLTTKRIKVASGYIQALALKLLDKNLIVLRGRRGYVMCGYLNLRAAAKFKDVAVKISGVATIARALGARVAASSPAARRRGIHNGQPIKEVLKIIV